ncbi:hypothetical protein [Streptomyces sp. NBC_01235]|uniref:hypothetical protein n=1 Tax=Streptomyces sp. NBC_01235 TaxID=2903788 RepID=UPI002E0FC9CC|nr:hypothetical protein OG289_40065 [Streptomyces sp. NBC_01235]
MTVRRGRTDGGGPEQPDADQPLRRAHAISDTTRRRLQRSLDLEEARLADA